MCCLVSFVMIFSILSYRGFVLVTLVQAQRWQHVLGRTVQGQPVKPHSQAIFISTDVIFKLELLLPRLWQIYIMKFDFKSVSVVIILVQGKTVMCKKKPRVNVKRIKLSSLNFSTKIITGFNSLIIRHNLNAQELIPRPSSACGSTVHG